jgi:hypothetical protein
VHPEDFPIVDGALQGLIEGADSSSVKFRAVRRDGTVRYIQGAATTLRDDQRQLARIVGVNLDVTERTLAEAQRETLLHDLGERVKELRVLHEMAKLLQGHSDSDAELFQEVVRLIPTAWQQNQCCEARIVLGDIDCRTPGWRANEWTQVAEFSTNDGKGRIEVAYTEPCAPMDEGPFLKEERALLDSLSEMLVNHLELRRYQRGLEALVASRTAELQAAKEAAESASRAKGAFLANMSH